MTTVAYIANEFPCPIEPYVMDEINELRRRGVDVVCCSGKRVSASKLSLAERVFWKETRYMQPITDEQILRAMKRLVSDRSNLWSLFRPLLLDPNATLGRRIRALGHTLMGAALADELAALDVEHIHAHHGYFASWMALVAARLLGIGFSFTLHGSDLLHRADLLSAKLEACRLCVTISEFNRNYILNRYPATPPEKIFVQRLGVDRVISWPTAARAAHLHPYSLLAVGRLHEVKNYQFLIQACAALRNQGLDIQCRIVGEGPERPTLEKQIRRLGLSAFVRLVGQVPRPSLSSFYRDSDLVVMTSKSEGIPVSLMEAMSLERLVLAPAITGIPELIDEGRNGFLYTPGSVREFVDRVKWIYTNQTLLDEVRMAAALKVAHHFNRKKNVEAFAEEFLSRIRHVGGGHAHPVLQQVRLSL